MRVLVPSLVAASLVAVVVALAGCSSGGGGDLRDHPTNPIALGTPIGDALNPKHPLVKYCGNQCPSPPHSKPGECVASCPTLVARNVIVTAIDTFDERGDGKSTGNIFVQDAVQPKPKGTPYSGVILFRASVVPATLTLAPGMGVELVAPLQPFPGVFSASAPNNGYFAEGGIAVTLPETNGGSVSLTYEGNDPDPIDITLADLGLDPAHPPTDPTTGMQYVGRLVRMQNVTIQAGGTSTWDPKYHTAPLVSGGHLKLASELFSIESTYPTAGAGFTFKSVVGVLDYFYDFQLAPRSVDDVVVK